MRLNRQLSELFNRNRSNFYLTLFLLFQSARHPHPPGQRDRTSCNATQRGGVSDQRSPREKERNNPFSNLRTRPSPEHPVFSPLCFHAGSHHLFFDLCQDPGCVHPLCNDEGTCVADGLAGSFCPGGARSPRLRPRCCRESPSSLF